jgi:membrane fusion protein (multidrug efflux system)
MDKAESMPLAEPPVPLRRISWRKAARWLLLLLVLVTGAIFAYRYWRHSVLYASTDNAYVGAHTVEVAAQVSGPVLRVYVRNNQRVGAGAALFDIDPAPYRLAVARAQTQLQLAQQSVEQQIAALAAAKAQLAQREAELVNARSTYARELRLLSQRFVSPQAAENARTQVQTAQAAVAAARASVEQARSALGDTGPNNASVKAAQVAVNQALLDLERTRLVSPDQGKVANLTLRPGDTVEPGVPLFAIIASEEYWVDANFKETEIEGIHPGQAATVELDMYPDHTFHGVVESISGGSGTAFSLLPAQNATGNWVKVTQRVPVRVRLVDPDPRYPLRIGTSGSVEVRVAPG